MQEYSEGVWPLPDMMGTFPEGWNEIVQDMLPTNECDVCGPPLDIGPPPPLPANFQNRADLPTANCNICHMLGDVETHPSQLADTSMLPLLSALLVGIVLIVVTLVVLMAKVKKCRSFFPRASACWMFPRNLLPHTELAPSSLPSPSPSTEKLKGESRPWNGSSRSLQSENIYEVCSPPSQDSLYEEVGPPLANKEYTPYGVVLMDKSRISVGLPTYQESHGKISRALLEPNFGANIGGLPSQPKPVFVGGMSVPHFSTFGGSGRGFYNPIVRETTGNSQLFYPGSAHTLGPSHTQRHVPVAKFTGNQSPLQKRKLPPVPADGPNFSL